MTLLTTCLWYNREAQDAAKFYASVFPDAQLGRVERAPADYPNGKKGDVLTVEWTMRGQHFMGLNGGPEFKFSPAISLVIECKDQAEVDKYWKALSHVPQAEQCGWAQDKFGLSWQIVPEALIRLLRDPDAAKAKRVFNAMMEMKKIDVAALERAAAETKQALTTTKRGT
ncbi:MAG: VOC family protein [Thermoplasmatota archaeon]